MKANEFIKKFVDKNKAYLTEIFLNSDNILKNKEDSLVTEFIDSFFKEFFEKNNVKFNLLGHFEKYDEKKIAELRNEDKTNKLVRALNIENKILFSIEYYLELNKDLINIPNPFIFDGCNFSNEINCCPNCGETLVLSYNLNEYETSIFENKVCKKEELKEKTIKSSISVPSGKLIFASSFYSILNDEDKKNIKNVINLNSFFGKKDFIKKCEDFNIAFSFSKDLTIIKKSEKKLMLAKINEFIEKRNILPENYEKPFVNEGFEIGTIYSDSLSTSAMDKEQYLKLCESKGVLPNSIEYIEVEVEKGNYHIFNYENNDSEGEGYILKIEKI